MPTWTRGLTPEANEAEREEASLWTPDVLEGSSQTSFSDDVSELLALIEDAGGRLTFDRRRDITLCAVCGRRSRWGIPHQKNEAWTIRLPWLGSCRMACSERCEWEAIGMRDGIGESD